MAKTREQKQKTLQNVKENLNKQKAIVFIGIKGLKAKDIFELRERLKRANCLLLVIKKTLLDIAFKENKIKFEKEKLDGQAALVFGFEDEISTAKIIHQFSRTNENLKILGGLFENKFILKEEVIVLAELSSKEELYSKVVRVINAPLTSFVSVLQGNIRGLVYTLSLINK